LVEREIAFVKVFLRNHRSYTITLPKLALRIVGILEARG
jgi:hypothetical protein